jgi:cytochrome c biogenesis protein CcmG/thiol:disulfide interchange protein DsbE
MKSSTASSAAAATLPAQPIGGKIDRYLRVGIGLLLIAFVYVIYAAIHERIVVAGDSAPGFTIRTDSGRQISVPNFGGKLLVLNFWATWCPPCVQETPSLSQFAAQFAGKGVVVLGISVDKDEGQYRTFLQRFHPVFETAREFKIHEDYGTFMYPETYFIDAHGQVVKKVAEGLDWSDPGLVQYVNSLL